MDVDMEKLMSKCNSNAEIRKICDENNLFEDSVKKKYPANKRAHRRCSSATVFKGQTI